MADPTPSDRDRPGPAPARGYELDSGKDVVLSFDVTNYQEFDEVAVTDPAELAKPARPPE